MDKSKNTDIKTQENPPSSPAMPFEYASVWGRAAALFLDSMLLAATFNFLDGNETFVRDGMNSYSIVESLLVIVYYVGMTSKYGATLGKMALKIKVVNAETGKNLNLGEALVREVVGKFVSSLLLGLGFFWAFFDKDKQTWHDKIAHTFVIKSTN